ncbi:MAG: hypothetical protein J6K43_09715 [Lachnospiraceae bacterium]|nr:hypothetical protein [Lachnospiraceae bacterium]
MNQDVIVGSVESSPSLNRYAYVEGNPVNYLDPFGLEKWVSEFKLEHELLDTWSRNLMIVNSLAVVATVIYHPAIALTAPLMTATGVIGFFVSIMNFFLYTGDFISAYYMQDDEAMIMSIDGMTWSLVSALFGFFGVFGDVHWIYNIMDSFLKLEEYKFYYMRENVYGAFE